MYERAKANLDTLEQEIATGTIGSEKLSEWKAEEVEWLDAVTHREKHEQLRNPYEPNKQQGEYALLVVAQQRLMGYV